MDVIYNKSNFIKYFILKIIKYKLTFLLVLFIGALIIALAIKTNNLKSAMTYLSVITFCTILVEFVAYIKPNTFSWKIKNQKQELILIAFCVFVSYIIMYIRFMLIGDFQTLDWTYKIIFFVFVLLFIYPVFLAIYFFIIKKYKPRDLGIGNWKCLSIVVPVIAVFGVSAFLFMPENIQFEKVIEKSGYLSLITLGFLTAAIPEEFTRMLMQTRLAKPLTNKALAWFFASAIWAFGHVFIFHNQTESFQQAFLGVLEILPIGLFWGFMTEKFKSILPSVAVHGTNLWGLHSIF